MEVDEYNANDGFQFGSIGGVERDDDDAHVDEDALNDPVLAAASVVGYLEPSDEALDIFEDAFDALYGTDDDPEPNPELARELFYKAGVAGVPEAWTELGALNVYGEAETPRDLKAARALFEAGAAGGDPAAQSGLAMMAALGLGGEKDIPLALTYYWFAADQGSSSAQMALGYRHLYGIDVPMSCDSAAKYYFHAANEVAMAVQETSGQTSLDLIRLGDERSQALVDSRVENDPDLVDYYRHAADAGDVGAMVALGGMHYNGGRGIAQDYGQALRYFQAAADGGNVDAHANLGLMYAHGLGVEANNETAIAHWKYGADRSNAASLNGLGFMYLNGYGVDADPKAAFGYFEKAAELNSAEGQLNLGTMYYSGLGTKVDYKKAVALFSQAANRGNLVAVFNLAKMHYLGTGTPKNCQSAVTLFKNVAERGEWFTVVDAAADAFAEGEMDDALIRYAVAAEAGMELAQSNMAYILDSDLADLDGELDTTSMALTMYRRASQQGSIIARVKVGDFLYYGRGGEPNPTDAVREWKSAADHGSARALFNMGYAYQHGDGVTQDFKLAKRYYDLAGTKSQLAQVPVMMALFGLAVHFFWDDPLFVCNNWTELTGYPTLGLEWDTTAIVVLGFALIVLGYIRHVRSLEMPELTQAQTNALIAARDAQQLPEGVEPVEVGAQ